ncbi:MAG: enoyl-CoA hydratase/isomerase family protein [Acidobacteria bacterium]|nr:enoyl-CoA hydratase/isomerase family protein [Acidobacteriota bacterium]MBI3661828.1 enoyl-CoA hydratase/isomerase family protein [Acidobacteriota bacterium]
MRRIEKVAVLGAGTMGARIAAHLASAGVPCYLLDIVPKELTKDEAAKGLTLESPAVRNRIVNAGLEAAKKSRPAAFFHAEGAKLITTGNFEDHLGWCGEADWIIEAVAERLDIKRSLFGRVEKVRKPGTIVTTNTSGLPIHTIAEGRSEDFQAHWAGTHFFNPPRYMKLVELIAGPKTKSEVMEVLGNFCDRRLGKGVVVAKDTPNFIANRIGTFSMLNVLRLMQELDMSIEEIDACTGPAVGWPKSATFRTADIVGLDVLAHVVRNIYENAVDDEMRERYQAPALIEEMLKRGWLGEKSGGGFYKKVKGEGEKEILTLDWKTMEYRARQKAKFGSLEAGKQIEDTRDRLKALLAGKDKAAQFLWGAISEMCLYAAWRIPEIADRIVEVDRAMKWGFAWELGPFEIWDAVGVEAVARKLDGEGRALPPIVTEALKPGKKSFYGVLNAGNPDCTRVYFDFPACVYLPVEEPEGVIILKAERDRGKVVEKNPGANLVDLGDGVVCCEFTSKMNAIGADTIMMMRKGLERLQTDFDAMVIANQAANFSVGANLMLVMMAVQEQEWDDIHMMVRAFQNANMALKYAPKPVVAAPQGMALGGGCEISIHATRVHAAAELYMGLVEAGVGLIPAGGGTKEMLVRANEAAGVAPGFSPASPEKDLDLFHALKPVFENIAMAKVSMSADEARGLGYLRPTDPIAMNRERLVGDAKQTALGLIRAGYRPAAPAEVRVLGEQFLAAAKLAIHMLVRGEFASEYDAKVATKLAWVLAGGALTAAQTVSEQYVLDLEREAFVSLCGERKTVERISHTLKTGKPLRN